MGAAGDPEAALGEVAVFFRCCPGCGAAAGPGGLAFLDGRRWRCEACGFEYFHNVATAAGLIIDRLGELVFVERAREPRSGKLGLPGGFVEPGESAEEGLLRECVEEIGWAPPAEGLRFLASFPNRYEYRGISYDTCDLYFYYRVPAGASWPSFTLGDGEAARLRIASLESLKDEEIAFPSLRRAVASYRDLRSRERREDSD
jgi:ADP-ribose pyrophosphatase